MSVSAKSVVVVGNSYSPKVMHKSKSKTGFFCLKDSRGQNKAVLLQYCSLPSHITGNSFLMKEKIASSLCRPSIISRSFPSFVFANKNKGTGYPLNKVSMNACFSCNVQTSFLWYFLFTKISFLL